MDRGSELQHIDGRLTWISAGSDQWLSGVDSMLIDLEARLRYTLWIDETSLQDTLNNSAQLFVDGPFFSP